MPRTFLSLLGLIALFLYPIDLQAQQRVKVAYASISPNFAGLWVRRKSAHLKSMDLLRISYT
jgi:hypothetical protein